jgi:hypothetical protein
MTSPTIVPGSPNRPSLLTAQLAPPVDWAAVQHSPHDPAESRAEQGTGIN